jgi:hypothetical protein
MENVAPTRRRANGSAAARNRAGAPVKVLNEAPVKGLSAASGAAPKRRALGDITNSARPNNTSQNAKLLSQQQQGPKAAPAHLKKNAPQFGKEVTALATKRASQAARDDAVLASLVPRDKFGNVEDIEPIPKFEYAPVYHPPEISFDSDDEVDVARAQERPGLFEQEPLDLLSGLEVEPDLLSSSFHQRANFAWDICRSEDENMRCGNSLDGREAGGTNLQVDWPSLTFIAEDDEE